MIESLGNLRRTHTCGALRESDIGREVVLLGWVHRHRDLGGLVFLDIRDRYGITQAVADEGRVLDEAKKLRSEYVVAVLGTVRARGADAVNPRLETGSIEVVAREVRLLNDARALPFPVSADEITATEETRLRYRYLDLRRPRLQRNLALRHRVAKALRDYFDAQGFLEIETPILTKSTPEGARDYLVPSRVHPGTFYALPQSPQIFKQILMVAGFDRYVQIVKCFRDEDQRADRQPEFTQIDVEISFATQDLVCEIIEPAIVAAFARIGVDVPLPLPRMSYTEALARYGSDKPDLRCGMPIADLSAPLAETAFTPFRDALAAGGVVRGLAVPGFARASRREIDELTEQARQAGGSGLVWIRKSAEGAWQSSALKALGEATVASLAASAGATDPDLVLLAAGAADDTSKVLGSLRLALAKKLDLLKPDAYAFTWVTDFPLLEWDAGEGRWFSMHHPFTSPVDEDVEKLATDPGAVRAKAYDLVLNGSEIGGGSIRIHNPEVQRTIFRTLGISDEEARARFGFFIEALEYGTPPHGGIALGLDRLVAILAGEASIRDVMAFPKTAQAVDLMSDAPSPVDVKQLEELAIRVVAPSRAPE